MGGIFVNDGVWRIGKGVVDDDYFSGIRSYFWITGNINADARVFHGVDDVILNENILRRNCRGCSRGSDLNTVSPASRVDRVDGVAGDRHSVDGSLDHDAVRTFTGIGKATDHIVGQ